MFSNWLSVVLDTQINVEIKDVVTAINNIELDPKEKLVSFDVTSLYTRVPAMEALTLTANKLYTTN